jgi:zinc transport system ATP-binding protein
MGLSPREACRRGGVIGYVPQRHQSEWRFPVNAEQVVHMGLVGKTGLFRWYRAEDRAYALELMDRVGVADLRHRPISELSGGQQQRIFIARALVSKPQILVLDEPLVGVDEVGQRRFAELIHQLHESLKLTIVLVSHDLKAIAAGCNRVACLNQTIHYHDAPEGLNEAVLREVFQHEIAPVIQR